MAKDQCYCIKIKDQGMEMFNLHGTLRQNRGEEVVVPLIHMLDAAPSLLSSFSLTPFSLQCP